MDDRPQSDATVGFQAPFDVVEEILTDIDQLQTTPCRLLFSWWREANGGALPRRDQFDITEHPSLAPFIFLCRRSADGSFQFRLHGEAARAVIGARPMMERRPPVSANHSKPFIRAVHAYLDALCTHKRAMRCTGSMAGRERGFQRFESIDCPMVNANGEVEFVIGAMHPL
jgi:hypothetical protein